jgi:P-type Mg2+ transporter
MDFSAYWQYDPAQILDELKTSPEGLSSTEAQKRSKEGERKEKHQSAITKDVLLFLNQFKSPLVLLLVVAVILAAAVGETSEATIILVILLSTSLLSFIQERHAHNAVEQLKSMIRTKVKVLRDQQQKEIFTEEVVPGDILLFAAGDIIPADCLLIESNDLHTNESTLTGETYPASKSAGKLSPATGLSKRKNILFEGTNVVSGTCKAVAVLTGKNTVFGKIAASITAPASETAFEKGIKRFGYLLMQITIILSIIILTVNIYFGRPLIESLLFGLALAVGMAPELLPAIMTIAMSSGAKRMSEKKVIVKKLSSIQNLGEINLFCSDKTGTLTEGVLKVSSVIGIDGKESERVKKFAYINAYFESGFLNPIDDALRRMENMSCIDCRKDGEVPYDFVRKRLSICVQQTNQRLLITKGAVKNILEVCNSVLMPDGTVTNIESEKNKINELFESRSQEGFRTIGVCYKILDKESASLRDAEHNMIFAGFILLFDPPKEGVSEIIATLKQNSVELKIITGDNRLVAGYIAKQIGLQNVQVIAGSEITNISPEALVQKVRMANVFAEIEPQQKENIIRALRKAGNAVAYMGDGINDVAAINAADVGISINNAVDVAREAADVVLLEKNLEVLNAGIVEGRKTFLNTLKYIFIQTSAMFGNMFSMAGASLLLPFLPMLPQQILLTNFLSDFPYLAIAADKVDEAELKIPQKWNIKQLRNFMIVFGLHSSIFDYLTFFSLYKIFNANEEVFHTGWFIESICTELLILFVMRTHRSLIRSIPGKLLIILSSTVLLITITLPFTPFAAPLGLVVPPFQLLGVILGILVLYVVTADVLKIFFFRQRR